MSGCRFDLVEVLHTFEPKTGKAPRKYLQELWYSPELRTSLRQHLPFPTFGQTYAVSRISVDLQPIEP